MSREAMITPFRPTEHLEQLSGTWTVASRAYTVDLDCEEATFGNVSNKANSPTSTAYFTTTSGCHRSYELPWGPGDSAAFFSWRLLFRGLGEQYCNWNKLCAVLPGQRFDFEPYLASCVWSTSSGCYYAIP